MELLALLSLVIVLLYILVKSADFIEDAFTFLAKKMKFNEFFVGFGILGIVTSLPELSIAITSRNEVPELSIGNLMGGSLIILTLIIGLSVLRFGDIDFKGKFNELDVLLALGLMVAGIIFLLDGKLLMVEGLSLILGYGLYLFHVAQKYNRNKEKRGRKPKIEASKVFVMFIKALLGVFGLLIASNLIVEAVIEIGNITEINESFIGLFVLALGTNTPELIMLITAKKKGLETERLVTGNFIGSVCANIAILGVLGVMSRGIIIDNFVDLVPVLLTGTFASLFFAIFSWTGRTLTRNEGILLVSLYASFVITEFIILLTT